MEDPQRPLEPSNANVSSVTDDTAAATTQDGLAVRGRGDEMNLPNVDNDLKRIFFNWLAQQGFAVILLFGILGFLAYSMVVLLPEIDKQRSQEIADRVAQLIERQDATISKLIESHDNDRAVFTELMRLQLPAKPIPAEAK